MFNRKNVYDGHIDLEDGYFLGFHVFGQTKKYGSLYHQLNGFFQQRRLWIIRP